MTGSGIAPPPPRKRETVQDPDIRSCSRAGDCALAASRPEHAHASQPAAGRGRWRRLHHRPISRYRAGYCHRCVRGRDIRFRRPREPHRWADVLWADRVLRSPAWRGRQPLVCEACRHACRHVVARHARCAQGGPAWLVCHTPGGVLHRLCADRLDGAQPHLGARRLRRRNRAVAVRAQLPASPHRVCGHHDPAARVLAGRDPDCRSVALRALRDGLRAGETPWRRERPG